MTTESEFKHHPCSQKMKYLLGDYLKNESGSILFDESTFLLTLSQSRHADLHLINQQFTAVSQSYRINQIDSLSCCTYIKTQKNFIFIYTCKNEVSILKFEQTANGYDSGKEIFKVKHAFQANDGFKALSKPFKVDEEQAILAYSQKDQFYLISLVLRGVNVSLQVVKLAGQQSSKGLWKWLSRQKPPHYQHVKLVPLYKYDINGYRFLCYRDNTAAVFHLCCKEQAGKSTIKQMYSCQSLSSTIRSNSILLSELLLSENLILLTYSCQEKVVLIKMAIPQNQSSITLEKYETNISIKNFKILTCKQHIYITFKDNKRYKCLKLGMDLRQLGNSFESMEALFESNDPIWLCGNQKELYLINTYNVYQIQEDSLEADVSQQIKKYQSFQGWIQRSINKKIKKNVQQRNYNDVQMSLKDKENKFIEEFKHLDKFDIEHTVQASIGQNIICSCVVRTMLSKKDLFSIFLKRYKNANIQNELREVHQQSLLENVLSHQAPQQIQELLNTMVRVEMFQYLNQILEEVSKNQYKDISSQYINKIFTNVCSNAIHNFKNANRKTRDIILHKILMDFTFRLISVDEEWFIDDFLFLANQWREDEATFVHNLALNAKLTKIFMHLFIYSTKVTFTTEEIQQIVKDIEQSERHAYFNQFFNRFKEAYTNAEKDSPLKQALMRKGGQLVKGFAKYGNQIEAIVQKTFPGLNAYLHLKNPHKQQYQAELVSITQKCSNPKAAYMLALSTPGVDRKKWKQTLQKIRLCKDLDLLYNHDNDILKQIEDGKHQNLTISNQCWRRSVQILEIPSQRAENIAKKIVVAP